ncbi:MAG: BrnT family toxin [Methylorubrum populi]
MEITFDPAKRERTLLGRGLDFARSAEVFATAVATFVDARSDYGERREITVGYLDGRMIVVVWTERDGACRIISMRKANEREQARYRPGL